MKSMITNFSKIPFVRNVLIMVTGTAAAQAISLALSPFITRLYGPEAFGLMGVFMAIVQIIAPISALTYPIAIVLPKKGSKAKDIARLSIYVTIIITVLATILIFLFNRKIVSIFQLQEIASYIYLIPFVIIFSGIMQVLEQWLIRNEQFHINAQATFIQSLIANGSKVIAGLFYPIAKVLIFITALTNGIKALVMYILSRKTKYSLKNFEKGKTPIKDLAKEFSDFPKYRSPQVLINGISQNVPVLLLATFFGPVSAGFFTLGRTVLNAPTQLIGKSIGDVFYPRISNAKNEGKSLAEMIKKTTITLALVGIIPFGLIIVLGPQIFSVVFGVEWVTAGEYARWIGLWIYFMFINQPSVKALPVLSAQKFHLMFSIFTIVIRTGAMVLGYLMFKNDIVAIAFFGVSAALLNIILILITIRISTKFDLQR